MNSLGSLTPHNEPEIRALISDTVDPSQPVTITEASSLAHDWSSFGEFLATAAIESVIFSGTNFSFVRCIARHCRVLVVRLDNVTICASGYIATTNNIITSFNLNRLLFFFPHLIGLRCYSIFATRGTKPLLFEDKRFSGNLQIVRCEAGNNVFLQLLIDNRATLCEFQVESIEDGSSLSEIGSEQYAWPRLQKIRTPLDFTLDIGNRFPLLTFAGKNAGITRIVDGNRIAMPHSEKVFRYCRQNFAYRSAISTLYTWLRVRKHAGSQFALAYCRHLAQLLSPNDWCDNVELRTNYEDVLFRTKSEADRFKSMHSGIENDKAALVKIEAHYAEKERLQVKLRKKVERMQNTLNVRDRQMERIASKRTKLTEQVEYASSQLEEQIKSTFYYLRLSMRCHLMALCMWCAHSLTPRLSFGSASLGRAKSYASFMTCAAVESSAAATGSTKLLATFQRERLDCNKMLDIELMRLATHLRVQLKTRERRIIMPTDPLPFE